MADMRAITVPLARGINTKSDANEVVPPHVAICNNGYFQQHEVVKKRGGMAPFSPAIGSLVTTRVHKNELLAFDGGTIFSYSSAKAAWSGVGWAPIAQAVSQDIIHNGYLNPMGDALTLNGVTVAAYLRQQGALWGGATWGDGTWGAATWATGARGPSVQSIQLAVIDAVTNYYIRGPDDTQSSALPYYCSAPRLVAMGQYVAIFWAQANASGNTPGNTEVHVVIVDTLNAGHTVLSETVLVTNGSTDYNIFSFDAVATSSTTCLLAYANSSGYVTVGFVNTSGAFGPSLANIGASSMPAVVNGLRALSVLVDGTYVYLFGFADSAQTSPGGWSYSFAYVDTGTGINFHANPGWAGPDSGALVYSASVYPGACSSTGILHQGTVRWLFTLPATGSAGPKVPRLTLTQSTGTVTATATQYGLALASRLFVYGNRMIACYASLSAVQSAYFVIEITDGLQYSLHLNGIAATTTYGSNFALPSVTTAGSRFTWAVSKYPPGGGTQVAAGQGIVGLDFGATPTCLSGRLGLQTHFANCLLTSYDGSVLTEHGFMQFPDISSATVAGVGQMADGTYLYKAIYEWYDALGQRHRSSPSVPYQAVVSGTFGAGAVQVTVRPLSPTRKAGVSVALYRTAAGGTIYYAISPQGLGAPAAGTYSAPGSDVTVTDTVSDTVLQTQEILYTVGGELPNDPPPPANLLAVGKQRLFAVSPEDPKLIYYSKKHVFGRGVEFSLALAKRIPAGFGDIAALAVMDDKVVIFTSSGLYYFSGDGPDPTGANDSFTDVQLIASDVGCSAPRSVVLTPEGLMFYGARGLNLLSRQLQVTYIGEEAEAYNAQVPTAAVLMPVQQQVRFASAGDPVSGDTTNALLTYGYSQEEPFDDLPTVVGQWTTWSGCAANDATTWNGGYVFVGLDGTLYQEQPTTGNDNGTGVSLRIKTGWIKLGGYARVAEWVARGRYVSPHRLTVNIYYDYSTAPTQTLTFQATDAQFLAPLWGAQTWGGGAWGDNGLWGGAERASNWGDGLWGAADVYELRNRMPTQLCEAVQYEFVDDFSGTTQAPGFGYALSSLMLLVEPQPGLPRLAAARTL